ncbi:MAG: hypothetical protein GKR94_31595 [Gammaproteobacteria bacterium]|nr:hypothetical protein [Gammaproteobacteria bacterium]
MTRLPNGIAVGVIHAPNYILSKNRQKAAVVIRAGPTEIQQVRAMQEKLSVNTPSCVYHSTKGLQEFARTLWIADVFISGATGVLHIAGALDIFNVGFYQSRRSVSALRWQTLRTCP